jgi:bifunctional DNA-binding transcriptional regulator/antitoxin component of YhaV-PrlF toxin-antitoxin module
MYNARSCIYDGWVIPTRVKVTRTGQVSLPAELRHRWGVGTVLVIDRGDYAIVRPVPADPVARLRGAHAGPGPASERVRADERAAEEARESARTGSQ